MTFLSEILSVKDFFKNSYKNSLSFSENDRNIK